MRTQEEYREPKKTICLTSSLAGGSYARSRKALFPESPRFGQDALRTRVQLCIIFKNRAAVIPVMSFTKLSSLAAKGMADGSMYRLRKMMGKPQYPTFAVFQLTDMCNSRCAMCGIWKKPRHEELSVSEIKGIFTGKLFSKLRWVNLTGGEPFMRSDFLQVVEAISKAPRLEGIAIPSNGFMTEVIVKSIRRALELIGDKRFISVTLSIDGFEKTHERIRGVEGAYARVMDTLAQLAELQKDHPNLNVGVQPTISKENVSEIEEFYRFMKTKTKSVGFAVVMQSKGYYDNVGNSAALDDEDKEKVAELLKRISREEPQYSFYYNGVARLLSSGKRDFGCLGGHTTIFMTPQGEMYPCAALSFNEAFSFGNAREDAYSHFFSEKAADIRRRLSVCGMCKSCSMMCDFISMAKFEFIEHAGYMIKHPGDAYRLVRKATSGKNPYF
jgi:radical SAM protein with 4Fe4S-binding SPASM domain